MIRPGTLIPMNYHFTTTKQHITVGLDETMDEDMINQGPQFIEYMVSELDRRNIPVITPAALYLVSGVRGMEWEEEPEILRFFYGRMRPKQDWVTPLMAKFREDFGDSL